MMTTEVTQKMFADLLGYEAWTDTGAGSYDYGEGDDKLDRIMDAAGKPFNDPEHAHQFAFAARLWASNPAHSDGQVGAQFC